MDQTEKQLEEDEERFHKLQMTDAANFNDRLDSLSVTCNKLSTDFIYIEMAILHILYEFN